MILSSLRSSLKKTLQDLPILELMIKILPKTLQNFAKTFQDLPMPGLMMKILPNLIIHISECFAKRFKCHKFPSRKQLGQVL